MDNARIELYAPAILKLLREVVSSNDQQEWALLLENEYFIQEYFNRMGLEVYVNRVDGFAFARQPERSADETAIKLPRLTRNLPLTATQTLLLILLREKLDEFLNQPQDASELIVTAPEMFHMMEPFMPDRNDQRKIARQVQTAISKIEEMGFIKALSTERKNDYIVQRVIKAKVPSEVIARLKEQLMEYFADESEG